MRIIHRSVFVNLKWVSAYTTTNVVTFLTICCCNCQWNMTEEYWADWLRDNVVLFHNSSQTGVRIIQWCGPQVGVICLYLISVKSYIKAWRWILLLYLFYTADHRSLFNKTLFIFYLSKLHYDRHLISWNKTLFRIIRSLILSSIIKKNSNKTLF